MFSRGVAPWALLACIGASASCGGTRTPPAEPPSSQGGASVQAQAAPSPALAEAEPDARPELETSAPVAVAEEEPDEDIWGGLTGDEIGEAYGVGGLGLTGTGQGGGGTGEGTIGMGNTGLIGKGGGGGSGSGYGRGSGSGFGGSGKKVPRVRQAKAEVQGALDKDIIRRIVRAHINEVRACYNQGLSKDPALAGRISIEFVIGSSGSVTSSKVESTDLKDAEVAACVAKAIEKWKFPKPRGGGQVKVSYPFSLTPG